MRAKFAVTPDQASRYARRGNRAKPAAEFRVYRADGGFDMVTIGQIAERFQVSATTAATRLKREQAKDGPVSWEGLA